MASNCCFVVGALLMTLSPASPPPPSPASLWQTAAKHPRACSDNAPLSLLRQVAREHTNAWCIRSPCDDGSGWALQAAGCWNRVPSMANDGCRVAPKVALSPVLRRHVECPPPCSPDKQLWLDHCNEFDALRRQHCDGGRCTTCQQAALCKAHFPPPNARCDPIPFGDQPTDINCAPHVIIIGTMKCGTNTLGSILSHHPDVVLNRCNRSQCGTVPAGEVPNYWQGILTESNDHVWEQMFPKKSKPSTLRDYARLIAQNDATSAITFTKSPSYMDQGAPGHEVIAALMPHVRVVAARCDPTERAYSEFQHTLKHGQAWEHAFVAAGLPWSTNFAEVVGKILPGSPHCTANPIQCTSLRARTIDKGVFRERIAPWRRALGNKRVLVTRMNDDQAQTAAALFAFAGLRPVTATGDDAASATPAFANTAYSGRAGVWKKHPAITKLLANYFAPVHNVSS